MRLLAPSGRAGYEAELFALLNQLVRDMDRKIERQKERAQRESEPRPPSAAEQLQLDTIKARACSPYNWPSACLQRPAS